MIKKNTLLTTLALVCILSSNAFGAGAIKAPPAAPVGDVESGKAQAATCAGCHGNDGNSPAPNFPKIANLGEKYLLKQMKDIQSGARVVDVMAGLLDGKSEQELLDMAAYFNSQPLQLSGATEQIVQINSGVEVDGLELGERVFRAGNHETGTPSCTGCHSPRGLGNDPAGFPRLSGQYAEYIAKQLRDFRAGNRTNDGDSQTMRQVASQMSDAEIDAVANYISGLN